ncbi:hypothetical protein C8K61_109251 [Pseudomonas sp. GV071]|jgi:hypothetical protein|nr:hypothetical protein C8K61_109251 [Pseudomonas sp. GV071]
MDGLFCRPLEQRRKEQPCFKSSFIRIEMGLVTEHGVQDH